MRSRSASLLARWGSSSISGSSSACGGAGSRRWTRSSTRLCACCSAPVWGSLLYGTAPDGARSSDSTREQAELRDFPEPRAGWHVGLQHVHDAAADLHHLGRSSGGGGLRDLLGRLYALRGAVVLVRGAEEGPEYLSAVRRLGGDGRRRDCGCHHLRIA